MLLTPATVPWNSAGVDVCILTFTASNGHNAISAMNSAEAEPARYTHVLYLYAFSGPRRSLRKVNYDGYMNPVWGKGGYE